MRRSLLAVATLSISGAHAQVVVSAESLRVMVPQGQESVEVLVLSTTTAEPVAYCLDFDAPLQRSPTSTVGSGCGTPGELVGSVDQGGIGFSWNPYAIAMVPNGRLFVAEFSGARRTYEVTAELQYVTRFFSPIETELAPSPVTVGITFNEDTGTLWWTNAEVQGFDVRRILLLEGTLDGAETGRRIEIPVPPTGPPPANTGYPRGASYDPATTLFYYVDVARGELWAIDTLGVVPQGYPQVLSAYPSASIGNTLDVFGGSLGGPAGVRIEVPSGAVVLDWERVVVTDRLGTDLGLETPLGAIYAQGWYPVGSTARSRLDPNGVMYATFSCCTGGPRGVAAIRPVPLSPTWLSLTDWSGTIPAGGSVQVPLTFRAGQRAPGEYRSTLVVEDISGLVLASVPLTMVVTPDTPAEPGPDRADASLIVAPNPVRGRANVTLELAADERVRLAVYDVLGREVLVLAEGPRSAGALDVVLDATGLRPGLYVLRAQFPDLGRTLSHRLTVAE